MAEFIMKHLVSQAGRSDEFEIASAAVSTEEIGNDIYPPAKRMLTSQNIPDVSDPWYTGDFEKAYNDILQGCQALLKQL